MAKLNGARVRERAAERLWKLSDLAILTGIPYGTLRNTTRDDNPDGMHLARVHKLRLALGLTISEILAPDEVASAPPSPARRRRGHPDRADSDGAEPESADADGADGDVRAVA